MDRVQAQRLFQAHNHESLHRLIQLAPSRHSLILELLPFLFHLNARQLPGYISDDTPAGLVDYRPAQSSIDRAQQLVPGFRYRQRALRRYPLRGLYLIHPGCLLRYPEQPQFKLWLLYSDLLSAPQRQQLQQKTDAICEWAQKNGVELQARLFSETELARGTLSAWDRDQFYSCGLILAGSEPYWWLTSPEEDQHYADSVTQLQSQRRLNTVSLVDFGAIETFDTNTLFHQIELQLTHCLHHGNQLLALAYLDHCLAASGTVALSPLIKQQLHQQQTDSCRLDPYYLQLQLLDQKLTDLDVRRAFYLSIPERLSKPVKQAAQPWRRQFMEDLTQAWGWDAEKLKSLDASKTERAAIRQDYQALGRFIEQVLKRLGDHVRTEKPDAAARLHTLKQAYRLRFAPPLDQTSMLPLSLRPAPNNDRLFLTRFRDRQAWSLSEQPLSTPRQEKLFEHEHLIQVLAFAIGNRLLSRDNWLSVNDQHGKITTSCVMELCQRLFRSALPDLDLNLAAISPDRPETLKEVRLFANLEPQATDNQAQQGLQLSSKLNDPLDYSSYHQNLITSIDGLLTSHYGLCHSFHFSGPQAVLETLRHLLAWQPDSQASWHSWCPMPVFGQNISQRLDELLAQLFTHHQHFPDSGRFLLTVANQGYCLQWQQQQISLHKLSSPPDLWHQLIAPKDQFEALRLDRYLDQSGLLNSLLDYQSPDRISIFIYTDKQTVICYLLDEFGNLMRHSYQNFSEASVLAHWHLFLSGVRQHNQVPELRFYRLSQPEQGWQAQPIAVPRQAGDYLPVKVSLSRNAENADCTISCGQHQFEGGADDPALLGQVRGLLLKSPYPAYLTSLSIEDGHYYPAAVYMQHKQRLEQLFNSD
ncbi:MAG: class I adenylate cyclase [Methylophaga sp.]